jgi:hypothetical protein
MIDIRHLSPLESTQGMSFFNRLTALADAEFLVDVPQV